MMFMFERFIMRCSKLETDFKFPVKIDLGTLGFSLTLIGIEPSFFLVSVLMMMHMEPNLSSQM